MLAPTLLSSYCTQHAHGKGSSGKHGGQFIQIFSILQCHAHGLSHLHTLVDAFQGCYHHRPMVTDTQLLSTSSLEYVFSCFLSSNNQLLPSQ